MTSLAISTKHSDRPTVAASPKASGQRTVIVVDKVADLEPHVAAWEDLAAAAVEPNVFHEPWMMLPALQHFAAGQDLVFVLVFAPDSAHPEGPGLLCGFFPLERLKHYKGLPLAHLRIWRHLHCVLSTPLIRAGYGPETLETFFSWLQGDRRGSSILQLDFVTADGPFHHLLVDHINAHGRLTYVEEITTRALLRIGGDGEAYLQCALSASNRKELRRQRRRLCELGKLETRSLQPTADPQHWIDRFLELESSGWKGQSGTALKAHDIERSFFRAAAEAAFARQRLMMLGLFLDDKPVALKCNFLMLPGAIAFKIAFDETYARFSPGVMLELDNILQMHNARGPLWMDSCAVSRHFMINRLWKDRRVMQTLLVATGRTSGDLAVSILPALRWLRRLVNRKQKTGE